MQGIVRAFGLSTALLLGACADRQPLISTPEDAEYFYGWDEGSRAGEFVLHFDPYEGALLGRSFHGARFSGNLRVAYLNSPITPWPFNSHYSPSSPPSAVYFQAWATESGEVHFNYWPVKDISFNVRMGFDLEVACYDAAGAVVVQKTVPGSFISGGVPQTPYRRLSDMPAPLPLRNVVLEGKGIRRCTFFSLGGMLDDLTYTIDRNDLEVSCVGDLGENRVTRGKEVVCTAEPTGAADNFEPTEWRFRSPDGLEVTPSDPVQNTARTWSGIMVRSGTVSVTADVGGQSETASVDVVVVDRSWSGRNPEYTFEFKTNDSRLVLPEQIRWAEDLGASSWFRTPTPTDLPPDFTREVPNGPNEGIDYFADETNLVFVGYYTLNTAAMTRGSNFYNQQEPAGSSGSRVGGTNWCDASIVTTTLPGLVRDHEEYHGAAYARGLARNFPAVLQRLESLTDEDVGILYDAYDAAWFELDGTARRESLAIHNERGNPGRVTPADSQGPCNLKNEFGAPLENPPAAHN